MLLFGTAFFLSTHFLCAPAAEYAASHPHQREGGERIIGGSEAHAGEFPFMVSLQFPFFGHVCGASVINEKYALTTAVCVDWGRRESGSLLAGTNDLGSGGMEHPISRILLYGDTNLYADSLEHDIALLEVKIPFTWSPLVQPVTLPEQDQGTSTGTSATVIGWGFSHAFEDPDALKKATVEVRDQKMCRELYQKEGFAVLSSHLCADLPKGGVGPCIEDLGGPLLVEGVAVGLVSFLYGCSNPGYPTIYTRVSAYRNWINNQTGMQ